MGRDDTAEAPMGRDDIAEAPMGRDDIAEGSLAISHCLTNYSPWAE